MAGGEGGGKRKNTQGEKSASTRKFQAVIVYTRRN